MKADKDVDEGHKSLAIFTVSDDTDTITVV